MSTAPKPSRTVTSSLQSADGTADRCTLSVAQYEIRGGRSVAQISAEIEALVRPAAAEGARLCLLPELIALDHLPADVADDQQARSARGIAEEVTPALVARAAELARELDIAILIGGPRVDGSVVRNTEYLLMPDGCTVAQDKLFLTKWERDVGWQPGDVLLLFDSPWGRSAIATCYDVEFPSVSEVLAKHCIEVLLVPSMTESDQGARRVRDAARTRASEHCAYVAVACTTGAPALDWQQFGRGAVIAPQEGPFHGLLGEAPASGSGLVTVELDLGLLRRVRADVAHFPVREEGARRRPLEVREIEF